jgi:hypothetical protein
MAMKRFNTTGPCDRERHYLVDPDPRRPEMRELIDIGLFFVLHAPRQSGKTTLIRTLARKLTEEGKFAALAFSCEAAEVAQDNYEAAQLAILDRLRAQALLDLPEKLQPPTWPPAPAVTLLATGLGAWARSCPRPLVLFFDEIDALRGESLRSVLRQLRSGFPDRPLAFPHAVILCGLRDVRDYKVQSGGDPERLGTSSPFNIKVASLTLDNFTFEQTRNLYLQHTRATGQNWTKQAIVRAHELTGGQPWLVNALASEIVERRKHAGLIRRQQVEEAKEALILERATHLDSLVARLMEPRVRRVIEPLLAGELTGAEETYDEDRLYVADLGLVKRTRPLEIANPIYKEVIARVLTSRAQDNIILDPHSFVTKRGRLSISRFLDEFSAFWREHGEVLENAGAYHEVAPQLVLMAYLQRVVNGGGFVEREYGVGRDRIDLLVKWPLGERKWQKEVLELKVWREKKRDPLEKGLEQLEGYLERVGVKRGVLVIFDRRGEARPVEERVERSEVKTKKGYRVTLLRA